MPQEENLAASTDPAYSALTETGQLVSIVIDKLASWITGFIEMLPNLIVATFVVILASLAARYGSRLMARATQRATHNEQIASLVRTTAKLGIFTAGFFVSLGLLNLDKTVTSLLAGVGVVGLALGFAFQDIASNFMSGVILAIRKPFDLDDFVQTHDTLGTVEGITLRATVLKNFDGQIVIIPNKEVLQNPIINYTRSGERRVEVPVGVAYGSDLERAREIAISAIESLPGRDETKPLDAVYTGFGDSAIDLSIRFWIDVFDEQSSYLEAQSNAIIAIKKAFDEVNIEIPFPIRTLEFGSSIPDALDLHRETTEEDDGSKARAA